MNIPISWLEDMLGRELDIKSFVSDITMSGSKVEAVEHLGKDLKNVVVGKITKTEKHPQADKLTICQVDIGSETIQIITGATNIFEGALVPVALDGAVLAEGKTITKTEFRGLPSDGMMCSIEELGYTRQDYPESPENGIYIFCDASDTDDTPALGADVMDVLKLRESVVEFEITSNRPDCYSVIGLARETAATYDTTFTMPDAEPKHEADGDIHSMISVDILNPELCRRYVARVVKDVKIGPSPLWMRHRLTASGIRPINNIVDITNYVMLETGQPMHAFDIDNIANRHIIVRNAGNAAKGIDKETFVTLDGTERELDSSMLVIADEEKAVAIAGIMGGENSKVTGEATAILFESANFFGTNIRLSSKKLGLRTDSSTKFEKDIDPNLALYAINRAMALVEQLSCGTVIKGIVDCYPNKRGQRMIECSVSNINSLLGTSISGEDIRNYLKRVEIETTPCIPGSDTFTATIPTFRPDVEEEADIIEEVARIYGYNNIVSTLSQGKPTVGKRNEKQNLEDLARVTMLSLGYCEAMTYSFESPKVFDKLLIDEQSPLRNTVRIINPLGEDFSIMRTTTANALLTSISTNYNRRNIESRLFEIAKVYHPKSIPMTELPHEIDTLSIAMYSSGNKQDFYDFKGTCATMLAAMGIEAEYVAATDIPYMHPGRTARIIMKGSDKDASTVGGYFGEIHPQVSENYQVGAKVYFAELNLTAIYAAANLKNTYKPLPKFPSVTRDLALIAKDQLPAGDIERCIRKFGGEFLESVSLFDIYKGANIGSDMKSMAYSITLRSPDRTLTDKDVSDAMERILSGLKDDLSVVIRQ